MLLMSTQGRAACAAATGMSARLLARHCKRCCHALISACTHDPAGVAESGSRVLQAQLALVQRDFATAAEHLEAGLRNHQPDDWAGYLLLLSCLLPGTALPFDEAAEGVFEIEGGFGGISEGLKQEEAWAEAAAAEGAGERAAAVQRICQLLDDISGQVCACGDMLECLSWTTAGANGNPGMCRLPPAACIACNLWAGPGRFSTGALKVSQACHASLSCADRLQHVLVLLKCECLAGSS